MSRVGSRPSIEAPTSVNPGGGNPVTKLPVPAPGTDDNKMVVVDSTGTFYQVVPQTVTLPGASGNALKFLQVNSGGSGYQLVALVQLPTLPSGEADIGKVLGVITDGSTGQIYGLVQPGQPTSWTAITSFGAGFADAAIGGYAPAARILDQDIVELRGQIGGGAGVISNSSATTIATLPTAFRPASTVQLPVVCSFPGGATTLVERMQIAASGVMSISAISAHAWASIDGMKFPLV